MPARRLVVTAMVVLGLLLTSAGAGLAAVGVSEDGLISGSGSGSADAGPISDDGGGAGGVEDGEGVGGVQTGDGAGFDPGATGSDDFGDDADDGLPRTGLAAIPLLVTGLGLLGGGLVLRRRAAAA